MSSSRQRSIPLGGHYRQVSLYYNIDARKKWLTISEDLFKGIFKPNYNFTEICSWESNLQQTIINTDNDLVANSQYSITWASYQICKIAGCACARNAGNGFPGQRGMLCCMRGSLTSGFLWNWWRENVPGIHGACATRNFTYLVRSPWTTQKPVYRHKPVYA